MIFQVKCFRSWSQESWYRWVTSRPTTFLSTQTSHQGLRWTTDIDVLCWSNNNGNDFEGLLVDERVDCWIKCGGNMRCTTHQSQSMMEYGNSSCPYPQGSFQSFVHFLISFGWNLFFVRHSVFLRCLGPLMKVIRRLIKMYTSAVCPREFHLFHVHLFPRPR